ADIAGHRYENACSGAEPADARVRCPQGVELSTGGCRRSTSDAVCAEDCSRLSAMSERMNIAAPQSVGVWVADRALRLEVTRSAAAAGIGVDDSGDGRVPSEAEWGRREMLVLDSTTAAAAAEAGRTRRHGLLIVAGSEPGAACEAGPDVWQAAVRLGAEDVLELPAEAPRLLTALARSGRRDRAGGGVISVVAGHGGAGASVLSA